MERIGIEDARQNLADIIKRVEAGEDIMLTRGRDIAPIISPDGEETRNIQAFFSLLKRLKTRSPIAATPDEIRQWIQEGRA